MANETDLELAKALIDQGAVSADVVSECLNEIARLPDPPRLADLLVSRGHLTPEHLQVTIRQTPRSRATKVRPAGAPAEVTMAPPGARFGKYVRVDKLGAGGMGEVWKAWDTELGRWVALKFLKGEDEEEIARFKQEAQLAGRLSHPNIAAIYDVGEDRDRHFIAMQFVDGRSLREFPRGDPKAVARILRDAARGVHSANEQGIVHRDLKPENLMITTRGGGEPHAYVMDFGLARAAAGASHLSVSGFVVGTPAYMPPEQAFGEKVDARADVYSLGATLYELLSGRPPFEGATVIEILKKVTEEDPPLLEGELGTVAAKAMEKDRDRRYATAAEFAEDLDHWLAGEPILARRASILYRARKRIAKRKALIGALAGGIALALALTLYFVPRLTKVQRYASAYDAAMVRVNEFGLAAATMSERRLALAADAVRALEEATAIDDRRPMAWVWLGRCRRALGQEASPCWTRALAAQPDHAEALLERCGQHFEAYRKSRGEPQTGYYSYRKFTQYAALRPETPEEARRRADAEADLEAARKAGLRGHLNAYLDALLKFSREDYPGAERALGEYLEQAAWDASARLVRARAYRYQRKYAEAEKDCRRVIESQPRNVEAHLLLGLVARDQHRSEEALQILLSAREIEPGNLQVLFNVGSVFTDLNRFAEAEGTFTELMQLHPGTAPAWLGRGWASHSRGEFKKAEEDYRKGLEIDPQSGRLWIRLAFLCQQTKRPDEALEHYLKGVALDATDPTAFSNMGNLLLDKQRVDEAFASYARALQIDPQMGNAHYGRARILIRQGKTVEGEAALTTAIELKHSHPISYRMRAIARDQLGRWKEALADWRKSLELEPRQDADYPQIWMWVLRARDGDRAAATADLLKYRLDRGRKPDDEWFQWIVRFLAGDLPRDEFLKGATSADPRIDRERKCEAWYYAGILLLLEGNAAAARELFEKSVATGLKEFLEYQGAEVELRKAPR